MQQFDRGSTCTCAALVTGVKVEIWSDVVCPWCYIGKRRFEAALREFPHPVELEWKSFQLDPHARSQPAGANVARLAEKYGRSLAEAQQMVDGVTAAAAGEGLEFRLDLAQSGNTFDAHRLLHLAKAHGVQDALKERFDRAYFTEGERIDDSAVLTRLAAELDLDAAEVLTSDAYAEAVRSDVAEARALGISGVPFFVIDRKYGVSGAQPADLVRQALQQAWDEQPVDLVAADACDDDACAV
ncbi:MAG: oxidoreductase [Frankiales bacterium]|nr:oxidoreductase [Frankiales bacterium]